MLDGKQESKPTPWTPAVLGTCCVRLQRSTTYEPPLYLLPELLPKVPQGSPPRSVWDGVADAVDIGASYWRMAEVIRPTDGDGSASHTTTEVKSAAEPPMSLSALVASNKLGPVGLHPHALTAGEGGFSAASIMDELTTLQQRIGLDTTAGSAIMSNHFINLLAWKKLREINHKPSLVVVGDESERSHAPRKRRRCDQGVGAEEEDVVEEVGSQNWCASPDPWSDIHNATAGDGGVFVSAGEENVEERVELLQTLTELYRRPWCSLRSQAVQTTLVVPPGTINTTSPYADPMRLHGATLDPRNDLHLKPRDAHVWFSAVLRSERTPGLRQVIPLRLGATTFGRSAGLVRNASCSSTNIDVGLVALTAQPELISPHHFSLLARVAPSRESKEGDRAEGDEVNEEVVQRTEVHTKKPALYLLNYSGNGMRVVGRRWVLGESVRLQPGDHLALGSRGDVVVEIVDGTGIEEADDDSSKTLAPSVKMEVGMPSSPVKLEKEAQE